MEVKYTASPSFWFNFSSFYGPRSTSSPTKAAESEKTKGNGEIPLSISETPHNKSNSASSNMRKEDLDGTMEGIFLSENPLPQKIHRLLEEKYDYDYKRTKAVIIGSFERGKPNILYLIGNKEYEKEEEKKKREEERRRREEEDKKMKREEERRREEEERRRREAIRYEYKVKVKGNQEILEKWFRVGGEWKTEDLTRI